MNALTTLAPLRWRSNQRTRRRGPRIEDLNHAIPLGVVVHRIDDDLAGERPGRKTVQLLERDRDNDQLTELGRRVDRAHVAADPIRQCDQRIRVPGTDHHLMPLVHRQLWQ